MFATDQGERTNLNFYKALSSFFAKKQHLVCDKESGADNFVMSKDLGSDVVLFGQTLGF